MTKSWLIAFFLQMDHLQEYPNLPLYTNSIKCNLFSFNVCHLNISLLNANNYSFSCCIISIIILHIYYFIIKHNALYNIGICSIKELYYHLLTKAPVILPNCSFVSRQYLICVLNNLFS